jgi:general secretion pathway protein C
VLSQLYNKVANLPVERVSHYTVVALSVLLIIMLALQVWTFVLTSRYQPEVTAINNKSASPRVEYQAQSITNSNLFGVDKVQQDGKLNLPTTSLELKLRGAFTSTNPQMASAIIEGPDGKARSYRLNNRVYGNASLHAVYTDRILLSQQGELETLYFPDPSESSNVAAENAALTSAENAIPDSIKTLVQENMSAEEIQQASQQLRSSAMTPEQRQQLIRQRLLELRNRARAEQ